MSPCLFTITEERGEHSESAASSMLHVRDDPDLFLE